MGSSSYNSVLTGSWAKQVFCLSALMMLGLSCRLLIFSWARGLHQWWWSFLWSPTQHLNHKRFACLWLSHTMGRASSRVLNYIWAQVHPFNGIILHKGELDIAHLFGLKGAIGNNPWLWNSPIYKGMDLLDPFSEKRRSPLDPVSRRTLIVFHFTNSLLLASCGGH